jgi:hypothetical protein
MTYQNYTCPKCHTIYGKVKDVSELNPMQYCNEPCLNSLCKYTGFVYEFIPESRE